MLRPPLEATLPSRSRLTAAVQLAVVVLPLAALIAYSQASSADLKADLDASPWSLLARVGLNALGGMALLAGILWASRERWTSVGFARRPDASDVGWGLAVVPVAYAASGGVAIAWLIVAMIRGEDPMSILGAKMEGLKPLQGSSTALIVPVAVLAGVWEEILFRGFMLSRLRDLLSVRGRPWLTFGLSSVAGALVFAAGHFYQGWMGVAQVFALALVLSALALWRGTIYSSIVVHAVVDTVGLLALKYLMPLLPQS